MASQAASAEPVKTSKPRVYPQVKRVLALAGPFSVYLYGAVLCGVLLSIGAVAAADVSARMLDAMLGQNMPVFQRMAWVSIALAGLQAALAAGKRVLGGTFGQEAGSSLRQALCARLSRSTAAASSSAHSGQVLSKLTSDLREVQNLVESLVPETLAGLLRGILAVAYMLWRNWLLALIAVFAAPAVFAVVGRLNAPMMTVSKEAQESLAKANEVAAESLAGAETVRSLRLQHRLYESFSRHAGKWLALSKRTGSIQSASVALGFGASFTPFVLVLGMGGFMVLRGHIGVGVLMAFLDLMNYVAFPMQQLPNMLTQIAGAAASAERVLDLLETPVERQDGRDFPPDPSLPAVEFRNVTFTYPGSQTPVLSGLSFALWAKETVALAGASGSGKTTVIRLLLGDFTPQAGEVRVFGHPMHEWSLEALRRHFSYVSQSTYLFPFSVLENLRLDRKDGDEQVRRAASIAQAAEFVESLAQGYGTAVGEVGNRISGGERQRLSLARAVLRRSDILLLDEATSALDYRSERQVIEGLREHLAGPATLVIAHRLSSVQHADRILILSDGCIAESGTHEELLARGGKYYQLYSVQQEGGERHQ